MTFYGYAFQGIVIHLHPYCSHLRLFTYLVDGLVADVGDAGKDFVLLVWNGKVAALVRYATCDECGVSRIEDGDVGVRYGLILFVDDGARQVAIGLVRTLHIDFVVFRFHNHTNGIEAYHL